LGDSLANPSNSNGNGEGSGTNTFTTPRAVSNDNDDDDDDEVTAGESGDPFIEETPEAQTDPNPSAKGKGRE
jgi:hypothetical protein